MAFTRGLLPRLPWAFLLIFSLALAVRLVYLAEESASPFYLYRGLDADDYHAMARALLDGSWPGRMPFGWPPLYPLFLGFLYRLVGQDVATLKLVQAVLGSVSCGLVYLIGRSIFDRRSVAIIAGLSCSLCGTLIYFDAQLLPANLDLLLQLLALLFLLRGGAADRIHWWALAGACLGLSTINRGGALLFVPVVLLWIWLRPDREPGTEAGEGRSTRSALWKRTGAVLLPMGLIILPVSWHNAKWSEAPTPAPGDPGTPYWAATTSDAPTPSSGTAAAGTSFGATLGRFASGGFLRVGALAGFNFYLGNHPELHEANDVRHPDCFAALERVHKIPYENGETTPFGHSRYLVEETLRHIKTRPLEWLEVMAAKSVQLLNGGEISRNRMIYADRKYSVVLSILLWKKLIAFPSGLILPLGLLGIILAGSCWRRHFLPLGNLATQSLFVVAFYVTARYRVPLIALSTLYAAYAADTMVRMMAERKNHRRKVLMLGLAVALVVLCNIRVGEMEREHGEFEHYNLATHLVTGGRFKEAVGHFREALALDNRQARTHYNLAVALTGQGRPKLAMYHYREALRIDPRHWRAHVNLGISLSRQGRLDEGVVHLSEAVQINPNSPDAHQNLGMALRSQGKEQEARTHLSRAEQLRKN